MLAASVLGRDEDIGSEGNFGKEGLSLKDKMLPTCEGSERQGTWQEDGCRVGAGVCVSRKWGRGRMQGVLELRAAQAV